MQVHHVGGKVVEQPLELCHHVALSQCAAQCRHLGTYAAGKLHLAGKVVLLLARQVVGVVHGEHRHLVTHVAQQCLGVEHHHAVATAAVVELVD